MKSFLFPAVLALVACFLLPGCGGQSTAEIETRDNMHKLHSAFMDYLEENNSIWPETLEDLRDYSKDFDALMTNPVTGDNPGYQYTPPTGESEEATVVVVQLRNGQPDTSLRCLYSDGLVK